MSKLNVYDVPMPYCASFPITGPIIRPRAVDYEAEAELLLERAQQQWKATGVTRGLFDQMRDYHRLARRKAWAEELAEQRQKHLAAEQAA